MTWHFAAKTPFFPDREGRILLAQAFVAWKTDRADIVRLSDMTVYL